MSEPSAITGLPDPQRAVHAVGMPGDAALDGEAVLLEDAGQVLRRLDFLEAELAEAEDHVGHLLRHHAHAVDVGGDAALQRVEPRPAAGWGSAGSAPVRRGARRTAR